MINLDQIEREAREATQGKWDAAHSMVARSRVVSPEGETLAVISYSDDGLDAQNATHIANMDPETTLALIGEVRRLRSPELEDVEVEAALNSVGITVWGPDGERFQKMFAAAMSARQALGENNES